MTITSLLAPIKERLDKATPGPYDARVREFSNFALCEVWTEMGWYQQLPRDYRDPTTELFVNAPTDLRKLIEAVEVMAEALQRCSGLIEDNYIRGAQIKVTDVEWITDALVKVEEILEAKDDR